MATFYASTSGSNTAPYDTLAKAATSIQTAINAMSSDGDEVVIDDEAWVLSSSITTADISLLADGSFTIRSLSGNPDLCSIDGNGASQYCFQMNEPTHTYTFSFSGIKFTNSTTYTNAGGGAVYRVTGAVVGDISFTNCKFSDFDFSYSGTNISHLTRNPINTSTMTLNGCTIENITVVNTGAALMDGSIAIEGDLVVQDCVLKNISKDQQANNQANLGVLYAKEALTVDGLTVDDITLKCPDGSTGANWPVIAASDTAKAATISNVNCLDISSTGSTIIKTGGSHVSGLIRCDGPFTISNITMEKASITEDVTNGWGCCIGASGSSAVGTADNITVYDCTAQHGVAAYMSAGASITITKLKAYNNTAVGRAGVEPGAGGAVYFGGDGDNVINYSIMFNNTADEGGAIYAHQQGSPSRSKQTDVQNCVLYNNTATGGDSGVVAHGCLVRGDLTFPHTFNFTNSICWNGGSNEIIGTATDAVVLNVTYSDIQGGADAVTGEDTYTNNINADPLFIGTNGVFKLRYGSPCIDTGVNVGLSEDFYGVAVSDPPSMGISENTATGQTGGGAGMTFGFRFKL